MKAILLSLDGSELANRAIPFATAIARRAGQPLILVRAVWSVGDLVGPRSAQLRQVQDELDSVAASLRSDDLVVETRVIDAPPEIAILDEAVEDHVGLIVMSTHGRGGLGRWLYGSVADAVLRRASVPVLVIPPTGIPRWRPDVPPVVAVPLDATPESEAALGPACDLADILGSSLLLLTLVDRPSYPAYGDGYIWVREDDEEQIEAVRGYLNGVADRVRTEQRPVAVHVASGWPFADVARLARHHGAGAIAMATHGRAGMARALLGSVSTATLQRTDLPVLFVRPSTTSRPAEAELADPDVYGALAPTVAAESASPEGAMAGAATATATATATVTAPSLTLALTRDELELLIQTVGSFIHDRPVDPRHAAPYQEMLDRLRAARGRPGST